MVKIEKILSEEEYKSLGDKAVEQGFYRDDRRIFLPGMSWFMPWYFDPTGEREKQGKVTIYKSSQRQKILETNTVGEHGLSIHYWRDWSHIRPPICVVCPDGSWWEIDRNSSNGDGWKVSGELPNITCEPSIIVSNYHGYLRNGLFTDDLDGKSY